LGHFLAEKKESIDKKKITLYLYIDISNQTNVRVYMTNYKASMKPKLYIAARAHSRTVLIISVKKKNF